MPTRRVGYCKSSAPHDADRQLVIRVRNELIPSTLFARASQCGSVRAKGRPDGSLRKCPAVPPEALRLDYRVASPGVDVRLWAIRGAETTIRYICGCLVRKGPRRRNGPLRAACERCSGVDSGLCQIRPRDSLETSTSHGLPSLAL